MKNKINFCTFLVIYLAIACKPKNHSSNPSAQKLESVCALKFLNNLTYSIKVSLEIKDEIFLAISKTFEDTTCKNLVFEKKVQGLIKENNLVDNKICALIGTKTTIIIFNNDIREKFENLNYLGVDWKDQQNEISNQNECFGTIRKEDGTVYFLEGKDILNPTIFGEKGIVMHHNQ